MSTVLAVWGEHSKKRESTRGQESKDLTSVSQLGWAQFTPSVHLYFLSALEALYATVRKAFAV